jgi:hypothetical protein
MLIRIVLNVYRPSSVAFKYLYKTVGDNNKITSDLFLYESWKYYGWTVSEHEEFENIKFVIGLI